MQPSPMAEISNLLFPSLRFCIFESFLSVSHRHRFHGLAGEPYPAAPKMQLAHCLTSRGKSIAGARLCRRPAAALQKLNTPNSSRNLALLHNHVFGSRTRPAFAGLFSI